MRYGKRIIFIILAAMGTLCFNGCQTNVSSGENNSEENAYMKLSAEEAKEIMDSTEDYILLDVREEDEYAEGHIKDALLMPYGEITERAENELPDKEQTILVYCRSSGVQFCTLIHGLDHAIAVDQSCKVGVCDIF